MKPLILIALVAGAVSLFAADSDENLLNNGDFEEGIDGWRFVISHEQAQWTRDPLVWEQKDAAEKSKGCLKVTMPPIEKPRLAAHNTGLVCALVQKIHPDREQIRVRFWAKGGEGGEILNVTRLWGSGKGGTVELDTIWKKYEIVVQTNQAANDLIFNLVAPNAAGVEEGTFWLDNVQVIPEDKK